MVSKLKFLLGFKSEYKGEKKKVIKKILDYCIICFFYIETIMESENYYFSNTHIINRLQKAILRYISDNQNFIIFNNLKLIISRLLHGSGILEQQKPWFSFYRNSRLIFL